MVQYSGMIFILNVMKNRPVGSKLIKGENATSLPFFD